MIRSRGWWLAHDSRPAARRLIIIDCRDLYPFNNRVPATETHWERLISSQNTEIFKVSLE